METMIDSEIDLTDLLNKCRMCFRTFEEDQKFVTIDETIRQNFFLLTSMRLVDDVYFSKVICHLCSGDLNVFYNFRIGMVKRQKMLLKAHPAHCEFISQSMSGINEEIGESHNTLTKVSSGIIKLENMDEGNLPNREFYQGIFVDCTVFGESTEEVSIVSQVEALNDEENENCQDKNDDDDWREDFSQQLHSSTTRLESGITRGTKQQFKPTSEQVSLLKEIKQLLKKDNSKQISCPRCFKFMHRDSIREHVNVVHFKLNRFSCNLCRYSASRFARLMLHKKVNHGIKIDAKYELKNSSTKQCNICGSFIKNWRRHVMKVHLNVRNFHCDICGLGTFFKSDMIKHIQVHLRKERKKEEKYYCESCGLEFDKRFHLRSHIKNKHMEKERNHHCSICSKSFFSAENLKKHVESHGAKDMPCEFCGRLFSCMNNLRTHLYYHSEPKFICNVANCDKKFYMRKSLRTHLKTHEGTKDFQCDQCDKNYFSQNDLSRHKFSIHERLRFVCDVNNCTGSFSRREYYKKHVLAHHQNLGQERLEELMLKVRDAIPIRKN